MSKGDALVTVATGELSDVEAERTGLVPTHAYAVLEVRTVNGVKKTLQYSIRKCYQIKIVFLDKITEIEKPMVAFEMAWKLFRIGFETLDYGFATVVTL